VNFCRPVWLAVRNTIVRDRRDFRGLISIIGRATGLERALPDDVHRDRRIAAAIMPRNRFAIEGSVQVPCALAEFGEPSEGLWSKAGAGTFINAIAPDFGRGEGGHGIAVQLADGIGIDMFRDGLFRSHRR